MRILGLILLVVACYRQVNAQSVSESPSTFTEYKNDNTISMGMDQAVIRDKYFTLKIPPGLQHRRFIGSTAFMQVLEFQDQAKIILLYIPNTDSSANYNLNKISYKKFIRLCVQEKIDEYLEDADFTRNGFFGMNKLDKGSFFALYLNVKRKQEKLYNYSIDSIQF